MSRLVPARQKIQDAARSLFWTRGYSNVSVRDITGRAGVDVALVSRYFGGKLGLFKATLDEVASWELLKADGDAFLDLALATLSRPHEPGVERATLFNMLLANIMDPEIGDILRDWVKVELVAPLKEKLGPDKGETHAAMLLAVFFGMAMMRKNFGVEALANASPEDVRKQIRHLAKAALNYES